MYARPISWTTGFNETSRILCTRTLQTSCSPWPCHCCCAFQEGKMGEGGIYSLRHPSRPLGANLATKRRASIWDLGHAPCLQHGMKERVVWCHVQWPRDPLTNLSPSCCSKITRLRSCTNNSSNGSLFYRPPSSPLLFSFLPSNWKGEETERFEYRSGKICSSCSMGLIYLRQVNGQYMGEEFSNILGDCTIPPRPSHTTFHQLLFTSKGLIVTHRD